MADLMETLIARERDAWDASGGGDGQWYRENLTEDAMLVFAGVPEALGREATAAAVDESTGGWEHYELQSVKLVSLGSDAALLTYLAVARRGGGGQRLRCQHQHGLRKTRRAVATGVSPADAAGLSISRETSGPGGRLSP